MFHAKQEVLKAFLAFVADYVPLGEASLATLGGEGLEASLWLDAGIRPESGWLIECKVLKNRRLMARYPYRHTTRLASFSRAAESVCGTAYGIDGFHLDLCGTYERNDQAFRPTVPLILRSRGKCLAVTVADQRRNMSVEQFDATWNHGCMLFNAPSTFLAELEQEHRALPSAGVGSTAEPAVGAQREFGFAVRLLTALGDAAYTIDRVVRCHYASRSCFRMRTYFFHFGNRTRTIDEIVKLWLDSVPRIVTEKGFIPITIEKEVRHMHSPYPHLQKLAEAVGGKQLEEFRGLIADAAYGRAVRAVPYNGSSIPAVAPLKAPTQPGGIAVKNGSSLPLMLDLLRAEAKGPSALKSAEEAAAKTLGFKGKSRQRKIGGFRAHAKGRFRQKFVRSLAHNGMLSEELLAELALIYTKLEGKPVSIEQLSG